MRSRTVLPVADRSQNSGAGKNNGGRESVAGGPAGPGLQRSATSIRPGMGAGLGSPMSPPGPVRGLSVRKPNPNSPGQMDSPPAPPAKSEGPRLTEIYDDYIGGYNEEAPPPVPPAAGQSRVAAWARTNANPANTPSRAPSTRAPSAFGSYTSTSVRRKPTRRPTVGGSGGSSRGRVMSAYEEEEEGYGSGEYEETYELAKIRVKVSYIFAV